jgi:ATP-dependent Clp protease ATP-binding subunit ClpX
MTKDKPYHPEDIQKEFEDFVKKRFGPNVKVVTESFSSPNVDKDNSTVSMKDSKETTVDVHFDYKPHDIKEYLDRFVIKQDEAKKALAIAVCDHYNNVKIGNTRHDYSKQNVLLLGPTGVGKTYLVKQIAKLIGVPFVKADATRFSETGYVGANVDDLIHELVNQAKGRIDLAQYGIIYLDEADKLASQPSRGKDISGRGVQFGLLKLMEETEVDLRSGNDMRSQMSAFMEFQQKGKLDPKIINTKNILFIISGAFSGIHEIIRSRLNRNAIGFISAKHSDSNEDLALVSTEDLIEFGFEPEFVGRLPVRVACGHLSKEDLLDILENAEGCVINQYRQDFAAYGIKVHFDKEALEEIAAIAEKEKTGARGLMTTCEKILRPYKFYLPSTEIKAFTVTREIILNPNEQLQVLLAQHKKIYVHKKAHMVKKFAEDFFHSHGIKLNFTTEAINHICESELSPYEACTKIFDGFEYGLKLIQQNSGQKVFPLDIATVKNAQSILEEWVRDSYNTKKPDLNLDKESTLNS